MRRGFLVASLFWLGMVLAGSPPAGRADDVRLWSDSTGKYRVEARFIKVDNDVVWLQRTDTGVVLKLPMSRLSEFDQRVAKAWAEKPPTPSKKPVAASEDGEEVDRPVGERPGRLGRQPSAPVQAYRIDVRQPLDMPWTRSNIAVYYASRQQPYAATNDRVIHLLTGRTTGSYSFGDLRPEDVPVLSPDGRHIACTNQEFGDANRTVLRLINTQPNGGERRVVLCDGHELRPVAMDFLSNDQLVWVGAERYISKGLPSPVIVFDVGTGQRANEYDLPKNAKGAAVDAAHRLLYVHYEIAAAKPEEANQRILRLDLETGKHDTWAEMRRGFIKYPSCSPRGDELVFFSDGESGKSRDLEVLDVDGQLVERIPVARTADFGAILHVQWLPDSSGWLLGGRHLIDREARYHVWSLQTLIAAQPQGLVLDRDRVLALWARAGNGARFGPVKIPRAEIARKLAAAENVVHEERTLSPGKRVALRVQVANVRFGDKDQLATEITAALQQALQTHKLVADTKGDLKLRLDWSESAGEEVAIVERRRDDVRSGQRVVGSGRATLVDCKLVLEDAAGKVLWNHNYSQGDRTRGTVQSNDEQAWRRGRVGSLLATLRELDLPQLVDPRDDIPGIPVVTTEVP